MRDPRNIDFPGREDPFTSPIRTGTLERKKRFTRTYKSCFYVLTKLGWLHEFASSSDLDPSATTQGGGGPIMSLFLPACVLGAPAERGAKENRWHVEGRKSDGNGGGGGMRLGKGEVAWTFRAGSWDEMKAW